MVSAQVPAGETSFACDAAASTRSTGRIRVAGPGFSNPTWRDVDAVAVSRDELVLECAEFNHWFGWS